MRGKIIQYNGADGSGTIVAEGKQYKFALAAWRGDGAPAVSKTVEIELAGDSVTAVIAVGDDVLLKEKAAEMSDKLGSLWNKAASSVQARTAANAPADEAAAGGAAMAGAPAMPDLSGIPIVGSIAARYGIAIPIAWLLFLIGTLAFNMASISMSVGAFGEMQRQGVAFSMFKLGGFARVLLILGYLSIIVPMLWRDRRAWLTLLLPLIAVIWAWGYLLHKKGQGLDALHHMPAEFSGLVSASVSYSFGFGFWLALIMAIIVAALAVRRFMASS